MENKKISILIVDDEEDLLEMYRELFEQEGFEVTTASSAIDGLEILKIKREIRLVISDSQMKGKTGLEFLKDLKETYESIPLFYLATGCMEQSEEKIKSLGGAGLVLKPFDLDEILAKIKKDLFLN
ncbi:MAG: response regulator [Bacteriovorax sp.]|nr:response regulator [Bacteriovorax sp.]